MPKFQLMGGRHITSDPAAVEEARQKSQGLPPDKHRSPAERVYWPGDVIEVDGAEAAVLAQDPGKFRPLLEDGAPLHALAENAALKEENARLKAQIQAQQNTDSGATPPDALDRLTVAELVAHAEAEEIDLKGAKTKDAILKAIRAAK